MTLRSTMLTFRILRFETTLIVGATLLSVIVSAAVIAWLSRSGYQSCITGEETFSGLCQGTLGQWISRVGRLSIGIVPLFPFLAGLLIGVPLVAREIEGGTARLAWSLGPSRLRWFAQRAVPAVALVGLAALLVGLTADALYRTFQPGINMDQSFVGFRSRGLLIAVQAVLIASIAVLFGAILGRMVPTFILSVILAAGISLAIDKVESELLMGETLISDTFEWDGNDMYLTSKFRLEDGAIVTWEEMVARHPEIEYEGFQEGPDAKIKNVVLYIPGERYHDIELREALVLLGIAGLFAGLAAVTVARRRPR